MGSLLFAARGSIDRLFLAVGGGGCSVVLADPRGIIVDRRGAPCDDTLFDSSGLLDRRCLERANEGTNGIGTCIVEQLGAGVWSRDANRCYRFGGAIQAGRVWTNCYHAYPAHAAFGGYKRSGVGR